MEISGIDAAVKTTCTGVEMFKKLLDQGQAGDNIGALLRGLKREDVQRGQVRQGEAGRDGDEGSPLILLTLVVVVEKGARLWLCCEGGFFLPSALSWRQRENPQRDLQRKAPQCSACFQDACVDVGASRPLPVCA